MNESEILSDEQGLWRFVMDSHRRGHLATRDALLSRLSEVTGLPLSDLLDELARRARPPLVHR